MTGGDPAAPGRLPCAPQPPHEPRPSLRFGSRRRVGAPAPLRSGLRLRSLRSLIRRAELARLECADANLGRGTLTVRQGKGGKDRVVPLGPRAAAWVARYLSEVSTPAEI